MFGIKLFAWALKIGKNPNLLSFLTFIFFQSNFIEIYLITRTLVCYDDLQTYIKNTLAMYTKIPINFNTCVLTIYLFTFLFTLKMLTSENNEHYTMNTIHA